jgi:modification methylase
VASAPGRGSVRLLLGDARRLETVDDASVDLVLTSPPYPMVPQWDEQFRAVGATTHGAMLRVLADAWRACHRALVPGGILAVVVGDALRRGDDGFRLWANHAATLVDAERAGFRPLPYVLWKKPTNRPNAYLGSGFLPPNAYVTLDCEFVLLFRKGEPRRFPPHDARREASRFSRAERDRWFSQVWDDVRGARQGGPLGRTGAFPPALAERLVRMFSVVGDTVLDPFAGTGTTLWAAASLGRAAVGVELDAEVYRALVAEARRRGLVSGPASGAAGSPRGPRRPRRGRRPPSPATRATAATDGRPPPRPRRAGRRAPSR